MYEKRVDTLNIWGRTIEVFYAGRAFLASFGGEKFTSSSMESLEEALKQAARAKKVKISVK